MFYILAFTMAATDGLKHVMTKVSAQRISITITNFIWSVAALFIFGAAVVFWGYSPIDNNTLYLIGINSVLVALGSYFYIYGLKLTDISLAVPMLSLSPIITALANYFLNGQALQIHNFGGILLVILGIYLLYDHTNPIRFLRSITQNHGAISVLFTSAFWGVGAALDKYIITQTNTQSYLFVIGIFTFIIFGIALLVRTESVTELKQNLRDHDIRPEGMPFVTGIVDSISVLIQVFLFTIFNPAQVMAVKRTSLLFGELFAAGLLKEKLHGRLLPAIIIISGAILSLI